MLDAPQGAGLGKYRVRLQQCRTLNYGTCLFGLSENSMWGKLYWDHAAVAPFA